ncbi:MULTISPECIES: hypothetical protein [Halobellus]|jgi:diadenylate cyclase|uniref:hypothetical protein n=1 Tax=Halobellus TaxID=1073986 RepID=UPI002880577F|nr:MULTISPECIES: hypothetical protein [unclassified Halobellus]
MDALDRVKKRYATSQTLMDQIRYAAESISLQFDQWGEQHVSGPSLYFLIVAEMSFDGYTDPLGANKWPVNRCKIVTESLDTFTEVARDVAMTQDGAIIVTADGTIQEQMVRVRNPPRDDVPGIDELNPADWMGTKHLSALETSLREDVIWAVTLSEEDGRVTTFLDGTYRDYPRDEIGGRWRPE